MSELSFPQIDGLADLASLVGNGRLAKKLQSAAGQSKASAIQAAKDFESLLLHMLLKEMRDTIPDGGMLGNGTSQQIKDIFWFYLAQDLAGRGGLGLWKEIYRQAGLADGKQPPKPTVELAS